MIQIKTSLSKAVVDFFSKEFQLEIKSPDLQLTRKEFKGQFTVVVFPYAQPTRLAPPVLAQKMGEFLKAEIQEIEGFNVVKGFLNIELKPAFWRSVLVDLSTSELDLPFKEEAPLVIEYSSPNTNKPLHLGHIRNNLLGHSIAQIIAATGQKVVKVQIINDRGIHICKSMYAWMKSGKEETPESSGLKGDKLVGKYYVEFDRIYKAEAADLVANGMPEEEAKKEAKSMREAQELLILWEKGDEATLALWSKMNAWVYDGFNETYASLGVSFDKNYYESETYLLGKEAIEVGLSKGVFYKKEDGSVWIDLTEDGLDEKLLLRKDGTSVYITQDIGTAIQRYKDFGLKGMVYTVGNEQEYHFKVLFLILKKLGYDWAEKLYHLSYGMVNLPSGRMKSREGTVVDADDLLQEMVDQSKKISEELGKTDGLQESDKERLYRQIGHAALKYFMLKVDPIKNMLFNPEESIDFNGNTGPFIQYAFARISALKRKAEPLNLPANYDIEPDDAEVELIHTLSQYTDSLQLAADQMNPGIIANTLFELTKLYNSWYQGHTVLNIENLELSSFRLALSSQVAKTIEHGMNLLGIECPTRM
jgi:arginyl-tRNA synthetase